MKAFTRFKIAGFSVLVIGLAVVPAPAQFYGAPGDSRLTVVIKADGTVGLTNEATLPRKMLETQIRSWDRFNRDDEDEETPKPEAEKPEAKNLSDEDLAKKLRQMQEKQYEMMGADKTPRIAALEVTTNNVRIVSVRKFDSLKELLSENIWMWGPSILAAESARFETETNGQLRLTFTPAKGNERYFKSMVAGWKSAKTKFEWKLVLPGKVVSSGLPETKDNSTSVTLDGNKPESVEALTKVMGTAVVIVAEAGGLKLETPLDSKTLTRTVRRGGSEEPELPITEAGPGFLAEPVSIAVTTVHVFPEGEKQAKDQPYRYGGETPGTVVTAKLFAPKGRTIQSVSNLRVLKAKDDKGRAITATGAGEDSDDQSGSHTTYNSDSDRPSTPQLDLQLGLPAADAQAIDELEAEGIVFSIGGWKDLTLTNVQADATREIDLGELLPGAKLAITKVTAKKQQTSVEMKLTGPDGVAQLNVKLKSSSRSGSSHSSNMRSNKGADGKTTRTITATSYDYGANANQAAVPPTVVVRMPQDPKRERVKFKLTTLDLL